MKKWIIGIGIILTGFMSFSQRHILVNTVGDVQEVGGYARQLPAVEYSSDEIYTYFSPDDDVRQKLITAIESERCSIYIAVFTLTDKRIAKALWHAYRRGVKIQILTDPTCIKDRFNKINYLSHKGIPVYVYNIAHNGPSVYSCMHHKFAIFGCNGENKRYVWTGSFNFTKSASDSNQENVVVIHKRATVDRFEQQFQKIKERSSRLTNAHSTMLRNMTKNKGA